MNYSLQYYPDPGIAFDIPKMLFVKLTPENIWKPMLTSFETSTQDFAYIQQRSEYFPAPKPELLLFSFYFRPKKMMFLTDVILKLCNKGFSSFGTRRNFTKEFKRIYFYSISMTLLMIPALNILFEPVPLFLIKSRYFSSAFI